MMGPLPKQNTAALKNASSTTRRVTPALIELEWIRGLGNACIEPNFDPLVQNAKVR
jgi:hypothetical protein